MTDVHVVFFFLLTIQLYLHKLNALSVQCSHSAGEAVQWPFFSSALNKTTKYAWNARRRILVISGFLKTVLAAS